MPTTDEDRFTALFTETSPALLAYAVRRVTVPADAADVVAETYLIAWRRLDTVPGGAEARPWLFGVARRVIANHRRGELRHTAFVERLRASLATLPAPSPPDDEADVVAVNRALATLGETDRELLRLVAWEELSPAEIATVLGVPAGTVRVRLHRARARLRRALEDLEPGRTGTKRHQLTGHVLSGWAPADPDAREA